MRDGFTRVVGDLLETDEQTVVVLAVISNSLFREAGIIDRHPDRVIDVGIREQTQIGVAGGLALEGLKPIVTGYAPFLVQRPFEQIKLSIGHQGVHAILASVGGSWDASGAGRTHQTPEDVALMATLPGWAVHVPGHPGELELILRSTHAAGESAYIRMSGDTNRRQMVSRPGEVVELRRGSDDAATMIAVGPVADAALDAVRDLDMTVLYTATPAPIDVEGLRSLVRSTDVVLVEPYLAGTSAGRVSEALSDRPIRLRSHGVRNTELRKYGSPADHISAHGLDAEGIRAAVA
ncbi:MAG: transketolase family protein [Acidimicrobiia bacterium]